MHPILFEFGPIRVASYGLMMAIGFLTGFFLLRRELGRKGLDVSLADRIVFAAMAGGLVGGKAFYLLEHLDAALADPVGMAFSGSGLAWYGGFMGGAGAVVWTLRRHGCMELRVLDAMAPGLVAGYFFGRGGCQLAGDGCYGVPTHLPWGMAYPDGVVPTLDLVHPAPVYEMLEMALVFGVLWGLRSRLRTDGALFSVYLVSIGTARFGVEFVRRNSEFALGLTVHQWISLVAIAVGAGLFLWLRKRSGGRERTDNRERP